MPQRHGANPLAWYDYPITMEDHMNGLRRWDAAGRVGDPEYPGMDELSLRLAAGSVSAPGPRPHRSFRALPRRAPALPHGRGRRYCRVKLRRTKVFRRPI